MLFLRFGFDGYPCRGVAWWRGTALVVGLLAGGLTASARAETVALGSFAHADLERNDPDASAALAAAVQAGLDAKGHWKFVERTETARLFDEVGLGLGGFTSARSTARIGKLLGADLWLSGTFYSPHDAAPYVILETTELARAEPIADVRVPLGQILDRGHLAMPSPEDLARIAGAADQLLQTSVQKLAAQKDRVVLKFLFFSNRTASTDYNGLGRQLAAAVDEAASAGGKHRMLQLERTRTATAESELVWLGLAEADPAAWSQVADYYIWTRCEREPKFPNGPPGPVPVLTVTLYDGRHAPFELKATGTPEQLAAQVTQLAGRLLAQAVPVARGDERTEFDQRLEIAALLYRQSQALWMAPSGNMNPAEAERARQADERQLLSVAAFLNPTDKDIRLRLTSEAAKKTDPALTQLLVGLAGLQDSLDLADRFLLSADGVIDPRFVQALGNRFWRLMFDLRFFRDDLGDTYVVRNLQNLEARITRRYSDALVRYSRQLGGAAPGQHDAFFEAAEVILNSALTDPIPAAARKQVVDALGHRFKIASMVCRAWQLQGERMAGVNEALCYYYFDNDRAQEGTAFDSLAAAELPDALGPLSGLRSPEGSVVQPESMYEQQARAAEKDGNAPLARMFRNRDRADRDAYRYRAAKATSYLYLHSENPPPLDASISATVSAPVPGEESTYQPLQSYSATAAQWLRATAAQREQEGYPPRVVAKMREQALAIETARSQAPLPAGPNPAGSGAAQNLVMVRAQPNVPAQNPDNPTYLDPKRAGVLLTSAAQWAGIPGLEAWFNLGAPIEAAGPAFLETIKSRQWAVVQYLLDKGYDPLQPWPGLAIQDLGYKREDQPAQLALAEAALQGRQELVDWLLQHGVRFAPHDSAGGGLLTELVARRQLKFLPALFTVGAALEPVMGRPSALEYALDGRDVGLLKLLLSVGLSPTDSITYSQNKQHEIRNVADRLRYEPEIKWEPMIHAFARANWREGIEVLLAATPGPRQAALVRTHPHYLASEPKVRAMLLRAELQATAQNPEKDRAGIELFAAIAAHDPAAFTAAMSGPEAAAFRDPDGQTALMLACEEGASDLVGQLMAGGARLDEVDKRGVTALTYAAYRGSTDLVVEMVRRGAGIDVFQGQGRRPLDAAVFGRQPATALKLIELGANRAPHPTAPSYVPLFTAVRMDLPQVVEAILKKGDNPIQSAADKSMFFAGALSNNPDLIQLFFDKGCDLNARSTEGWTPLYSAVRWGAAASVQKLLELGLKDPRAADLAVRLVKDARVPDMPDLADLRKQPYRVDFRRCYELMTESGQVASSGAAQETIFWQNSHSLEEARAFLARGGSPNYIGNLTPLQLAVARGDLPLADLLLQAGADPNALGHAPVPQSALERALSRPDLVALLLQHGADPNPGDGQGVAPLTLALSNEANPPETVRLLRRYGARVTPVELKCLQILFDEKIPRAEEYRQALLGK